MSTIQETEARIEPLTESNFSSWFVDTRARLRSKKLWEYTQDVYTPEEIVTSEDGKTPQISKKEEKKQQQWEEKSQEAADLMTPTISRPVKQKLTEAEFNDGYLMLTRLRILLQPSGSSEFMRLSKEYYSLRFNAFKSMSEYLTHIKVLEEKIDATKITLDTNNRTILCLSMSLPQEYQYLVQIWAVTEGITAEKARTMLLEASRQHKLALHNTSDRELANARHANKTTAQGAKCEHCGGKHASDQCWPKFPHLAPEWFQVKLKYEKEQKQKKEQAKLAKTSHDDFEDYWGTHMSC